MMEYKGFTIINNVLEQYNGDDVCVIIPECVTEMLADAFAYRWY